MLARFLHPDIDEFMAPSPAKHLITSTPAKRTTALKPTTPADHLLSLIASPAPPHASLHDYTSPTSRSTHTARSSFLSSTGKQLLHTIASPSQQILADITRKHAHSPEMHRRKRRRMDGTIPFAVIKGQSGMSEPYRPTSTTVRTQHARCNHVCVRACDDRMQAFAYVCTMHGLHVLPCLHSCLGEHGPHQHHSRSHINIII